MFTGLIQEVGRIIRVDTTSFLLSIDAPKTAAVSQIGDSIAINGCCLTAVKIDGSRINFNLLQETLHGTNLGKLQPNSPVNCEPALAANQRLGGHFVQGHVDTTAVVLCTSFSAKDYRLEIELAPAFAHYLISKGSIAVNGVSLTVATLNKDSFVIWIIPHTLEQTNLGNVQIGNQVNLEFDMFAKYIERMGVLEHFKTYGGPEVLP